MKDFVAKIIKWLGWFIVHYGTIFFTFLAAVCTAAFKNRLDMEHNDKALAKWMEEHHPEL